MSNSKMVVYTKLSPNCNKPRNHAIDTITIHCVVGQLSAESICGCFTSPARQASCNYGIGFDGRVSLCVDEANRSWCTSSAANDHRAITIEVASDKTHPYAVTDKALAALIELCADICKRNGIKKLLWKADKNLIGQVAKQNMTVHRWFANKACPGDYLYNLHGKIADEVNKRLGSGGEVAPEPPAPAPGATFSVGDTVNFTGSKRYTSSNALNGKSCKPGSAKVTAAAKSGKHLYHLVAVAGKGSNVYGWVDAADIAANGADAPFATSYRVRVTTDDLNIRKGPGTSFGLNGAIKDKGLYTIVAESAGPGAKKWGKLKSGDGWISLDFTKKV